MTYSGPKTPPILVAYRKYDAKLQSRGKKSKIIKTYMCKAYKPNEPDGALAYWLEVEDKEGITTWQWFTHRNYLWKAWQAAVNPNLEKILPPEFREGITFLFEIYDDMLLSSGNSLMVIHFASQFSFIRAKDIYKFVTQYNTFFMHTQYYRKEVGIPIALQYESEPDKVGGHYT